MAQGKVDKQSVILAAGGVISRQNREGTTQVLLVRRERYDDWCLPKGKLENNELFEEAALREVSEETGYKTRITGFAGCVYYRVKERQKIVLFWNMETVGSCSFEPSEEVRETRWMSVREAVKIMDYGQERNLLEKVLNQT